MNESLHSFFVLLGPLADLCPEFLQSLLLVVTQPFLALAFELVELFDGVLLRSSGELLRLLDLTGQGILLLLVEMRDLVANVIKDFGRVESDQTRSVEAKGSGKRDEKADQSTQFESVTRMSRDSPSLRVRHITFNRYECCERVRSRKIRDARQEEREVERVRSKSAAVSGFLE